MHARIVRLSAFVASTLGAAFLVGSAIGSAYAYPLHQGICDGINSFGYYFSGSIWTPTMKSLFDSGASKWEVVPKPNGSVWVNAYSGGSVPVTVHWGGTPGKTHCNAFGTVTSVEMSASLGTAEFEGVATHEAGHAFGLAHSGPYDSWDYHIFNVPSMVASCQLGTSHYYHQSTLEQDDWEALGSRNSPWSLLANESFEYNPVGSRWPWGLAGGESMTILTGGAAVGSDYARTYGYAGAIYQTARVEDPGDMRGAYRAKKYYSTSSGFVWGGIYARRIDYDTGSCDDDAVHHWDLSDPQFDWGTNFVYRTGTNYLYPTTSWQQIETPSWTEVDGWEGVDVRFYVYNFMTDEGSSTYVRLDDARVRHLP